MVEQKGDRVCPHGGCFDWRQINWQRCHREVRRIQARIVKATKQGQWGKVKALQWLLTHSFYGKALAVRRVTENRGKKTPGVDGVTWSSPPAKSKAVLSLKRSGYHPLPLRRIYIPKSNGKKRPLGIPTIKDRTMQALYLLALAPVAETISDKRSYGFRPERSTADAIEQSFKSLSQKHSAKWILEGDIKGCFDNISHDWLLANIPMDSLILMRWLKVGYMEDGKLFPTDMGTPQGGVISATLMNLTLDGLEKILNDRFSEPRIINNVKTNLKVNYIRYADDFIVTGVSKELLEQEALPLIRSFLKSRGLELSVEKTKITHIDDGFDFLGQNLRKYRGKLLIKPSESNTKTFLKKVKAVIKRDRSATQMALIKSLNLLIRGWTNYHRHIVSKKHFRRVKDYLFFIVWRWACRRHRKKPKAWVFKRYYHKEESGRWVFSVKTGRYLASGAPYLVRLINASEIKITRHRVIKMAANPFDPAWEAYFEERMSLKMRRFLKGRTKLFKIWQQQNGRCPVCEEPISKQSGWHVHHIIRRVDGGEDRLDNLMMVHPTCHFQIHASNQYGH